MRLDCGCPSKYPDWEGKDIDLSGQPVHVLPVPMFLHMPLGYENYLKRQWNAIQQLELDEQWPGLVLTQTGFFRGKIISLLTKGDSLSRHVRNLPIPFQLSGMLHKGGIGTIKNSVRKLQNVLFDEGRRPKELYLCYLSCPQCSAERGGEKILLLRRWVETKTRKIR